MTWLYKDDFGFWLGLLCDSDSTPIRQQARVNYRRSKNMCLSDSRMDGLVTIFPDWVSDSAVASLLGPRCRFGYCLAASAVAHCCPLRVPTSAEKNFVWPSHYCRSHSNCITFSGFWQPSARRACSSIRSTSDAACRLRQPRT